MANCEYTNWRGSQWDAKGYEVGGYWKRKEISRDAVQGWRLEANACGYVQDFSNGFNRATGYAQKPGETAVAADQAPKTADEPTTSPASAGQPPITPIPGADGKPQSNAGGTTTYASATGNDAGFIPLKLVVNTDTVEAPAALSAALNAQLLAAKFHAAATLASVRQAA